MEKLKQLLSIKKDISKIEEKIKNINISNNLEINKQDINCSFTYGELNKIRGIFEHECARMNVQYYSSPFSSILRKIDDLLNQ